MTEIKQRIAIAKACGLIVALNPNYQNLICAVKPQGMEHYHPWANAPDYLHDLNACHEMEKVLTMDQRYAMDNHLYVVVNKTAVDVSTQFLWSATASQRCEAFLKTIGKWEES